MLIEELFFCSRKKCQVNNGFHTLLILRDVGSNQPPIRDRIFPKCNNKMTDAEEIQYDNDCLVISIDIVDCPMGEIPLTEVFDVPTKTLVDNYHDGIRDSVRQQLEHTTWLSADLLTTLTDPGFGMYHARDRNSVIMLRKPALQRLIIQRLMDRSRPSDIVHIPVLIRFLLPDVDIPKPPSSSVASDSVHESRSRRSRAGPP